MGIRLLDGELEMLVENGAKKLVVGARLYSCAMKMQIRIKNERRVMVLIHAKGKKLNDRDIALCGIEIDTENI